MFRKLRRSNQQMTLKECEELLNKGTEGVLALCGDGGYPYALPINYIYKDGAVYFHCGKMGHKIDAIRNNPKASFCVIGGKEVIPDKYTTKYSSVIVFGKMTELYEGEEFFSAIHDFTYKFVPNGTAQDYQNELSKDIKGLCILKLTPEHISGKMGREMLKEKNKEIYYDKD